MEKEKSKVESFSFTFGNPTNYQAYLGYWKEPKKIPNHDAEIQLIDDKGYWSKDNIKIVGKINAQVSGVEHIVGYNGGIYTVTITTIN